MGSQNGQKCVSDIRVCATFRGNLRSRSEASTASWLPITIQNTARRVSVFMRCAAASFRSSAPPSASAKL